MSFTNPTTASTSVVLVPTATSNAPYYIYLNNVSTAGRIVTVRDNDGFASLNNQIVVSPINGAYFVDGTSSITINQPYGYISFNTALNGGYGILNTFGFPAGSAAAFVSNVTSCNLTTSTLGAQFITAPIANFNTVTINTISAGNILIPNFTPSSIAVNGISTGSITGGSASFQTIFGSSITTNSLALASLTATTGNFTNITVTNTTTTSNLVFTGNVAINGSGQNVQIGASAVAGLNGVAIGANARSGGTSVAIGINAGSATQGDLSVAIGSQAGQTSQGQTAVAVGRWAALNNQGDGGVAVGEFSGGQNQGISAVAIGRTAGSSAQGGDAVAVGWRAAFQNQGASAVALGPEAASNAQGIRAVAIGSLAGNNLQGQNSIAIGFAAGQTNQHANTTIINATGSALNSATTNSLYVAPIRDDQSGVGSRVAVYYNQTTKEMTTGPATGTNLTVSSIVTNTILTNSLSTNQLVASTIQTNTISTSLITGTGISLLSISTGTTLTGTLQTNTLSSGTASFGLGNVSTINTNSISTASLNVGSLNVNSLSTGSITLATASIGSLATNAISSGTITTNSGTISTFTAGSIIANTERVGSLNTNFISANVVNITGPTSMINARTQNVFVVNGNDSAIDLKYSLDGITWCNSVANGGFSGSGSKVAWNGSLFVAVGSDTVSTNTIKYSSDGSNWFNSSPGGFTIGGIVIAWNGRMWVATGNDATSQGRIKYSFNGSNWSNANTTTFSSSARGVAWGNGRWVVAGIDAGGAANSIMTSSDGSNWSFATNTTGNVAGSPAYNGSYWLMGANGANSNAILYSSNALTWNCVESTAFTTGCYQLGWNGSYWVALGEGGATIQTSQNGMVWTPATSGLFGNFGGSIVWNGSFWLAGGYDVSNPNAAVKFSRDGSNWTNTNFGSIPYVGSANGLAYTNQLIADVTTQEMNIYSQNVPNVLQSTNKIVALTSSLVLNNTLYVNQPANYVGINASIPQAPLHVVGGLNGQVSQIMLQTLGSTLNTSVYISTNVGQATLGVVGPSNGFLTNTVPGDTVLTTARTTNRLVMGNGTQIGLFISSGTVVVPGTLSIGGSISTASISTSAASFNNITVASSTLVSTLFFTGDVSIQAATDKIRMGSNAGITGQGQGAIAIGAAAGKTTQASGAVAIGSNAGQTTQASGAVAIGSSAGNSSQGSDTLAIGNSAGQTSQGTGSVGLGVSAGQNTQGNYGIAIGASAAQNSQGIFGVAIGNGSGQSSQGSLAIGIGYIAGQNTQGDYSIAIGTSAGQTNQGVNSIAIGRLAGTTNQDLNSIIINASGTALNSATTNAFYIAPIRDDQGITGARTLAYYNATTKEITTGPTTSLVLSSLTVAGSVAFPAVSTNTLSTTTVNAATVNAATFNASSINTSSIIASSTLVNFISAGTMKISSIGIGIGTSTPQFTLDMIGESRVNGNILMGESNGFMRQTTSGGDVYMQVGSNYSSDSAASLHFGTIATTNRTMTINTNTKRVGIGIISPSVTLQVSSVSQVIGSGQTYGINVGRVGSAATTGFGIQQYNTLTSGVEFSWFLQDTTGGGVTKDTYTLYGYPGVNKCLEVSTNGIVVFYSNVGINTSPTYLLDVAGAINTSCGVLISSTSVATDPLIRIETGTADGFIGQFTVGESGPCYSVNYFLDTNTNISTIPNSGRATGMIKLAGVGSGIQFFTGSTNQVPIERMRITPAGNVGIGTTAPLNDFDVNGRTYLRSTLYLGQSAKGSEIRFNGTTDDDPGQFTHTVISERIYEATQKSELLLFKGNDVPGTSGPDRVRVLTSGAFQVDCGGVMSWNQGGGAPPVATYSNALYVNGANGYVGIGTASPGYAFTALGISYFGSNVADGNTRIFTGLDSTVIDMRSPTGGITYTNYVWSTAAAANRFETYIYGNGNEGRVWGINTNKTVFFDSNVGIRTTAPAASLHVVGAGNASLLVQGAITSSDTSIMLSNAGGYYGQFCLAAGSGSYNTNAVIGDTIIRTQATSNKLILNNSSSGLGLCLSNNTVGIGQVPGATFQLDLSTANARKASGASWLTVSDERVKTDIVLANSFICYSTIKAIPLKYYQWNIIDPVTQTKIKRDDKHELGFIAQEVEKVFPNAVKQSEEYGLSNFRTLDVDQVYKMHYGATQYLGEQVEQQSTMIQTLTSQVAELQQAVSTLVGRATV